MPDETQPTATETPAQQNPPAQATPENNPGMPEPVNNPAPVASETEALENTIASLGSFISEETKAAMREAAKKTGTAPSAPAAPAAPATEDKKEDPAKAPEKKEEIPNFKSKFFKQPDGKKTPEAAIVIENPDQIIGVVKSKFGMELKGINELPKFFEATDTWRKDSQKLKTVEKEHLDLKGAVESLPAEFFDAFDRISKGEDWMEAFQGKSKLDLNVAVDKQDIKALVNHYYPGKFTEDDFTADKKSDLLEMAETTAKDKFLLAKTQHDTKRAAVAENATKQVAAYKASVTGSVQSLKQSFPDTDEETINEVSSLLEGGVQNVMSLFVDKNGTIKPEAAEMLMMAKYGKEEITRMMEFAAKRTETEINEDLLTRGADGPAPQKKIAPGNDSGVTESEKKKIEELTRLKTQSKQQTFS